MDTTKKIYSYDELKEILNLHSMWIRNETGGKRADLSNADLTTEALWPLLRSANLESANLYRANLYRANLVSANLYRANLYRANLYRANLYRANLYRANLESANLESANLVSANLESANLVSANLESANLESANLVSANLSTIKNDLIAEILKLPSEIPFLRQALIDGKIDGSTYTGECACLAGTMANAKKLDDYQGDNIEITPSLVFHANPSSPREKWFLNIGQGDTPDNHSVAKITLGWIDEAIAMVANIRGDLAA